MTTYRIVLTDLRTAETFTVHTNMSLAEAEHRAPGYDLPYRIEEEQPTRPVLYGIDFSRDEPTEADRQEIRDAIAQEEDPRWSPWEAP